MSPEFHGTNRFAVLECLGTGGMGVVYRVRDRERDEVVALKTLRWASPAAIYRLKREFRSIADLTHPSLVTLYELIAEESRWFYTMELIDGVAFTEFTHSTGPNAAVIRRLLTRLAEGIQVIHQAGKIHRDLKPSNVLVTPEERVVILDLGIARDLPSTGDMGTVEEGIWGTTRYMAPEQAEGTVLTASDWYAFGTMLYESLAGEVPFTGTSYAVVARKLTEDAPPLLASGADLPGDLVDLTRALLRRDPAERPNGAEVLECLSRTGERRPPARSSPLASDSRSGARLVGRGGPLAELVGAAELTASRPVLVLLHGPSGIGKSALLRAFAEESVQKRSALVLEGRCYERESVPFKGLEGVVDSLARYLRTRPTAELAATLPHDLHLLGAMFPTLARVEAIASFAGTEHSILDPREVRRRAVLALRRILQNLAAPRPLIICVDDLQWADEDSVGLLEDLLLPLDPPGFLVIAAFRSEEVGAKPWLRRLLRSVGTSWRRALSLGPLTASETRALIAHLKAPDEPPIVEAHVESLVRESMGVPFLVEQLVRHLRSASAIESPGGTVVSLPEMLEARLRLLPDEARALLDLVAVVGHPIDARVAWAVVGGSGDERRVVTSLRNEQWLRFSGSSSHVEFYHDRIREAIRSRLSTDRAVTLHRGFSEAMEARGVEDPEELLERWLAAGDLGRAASYAVAAAERAAAALAFQRAATLYRRAIELSGEDAAPDLSLRLAESLASAGHGAEAAQVYLQAAGRADRDAALGLRRLAAEQLLRCGHIDRGLAVLQAVLDVVGYRLASSPREALFRVLSRRVLLRLGGLRFKPAKEELSAETIERLDTCWAVAIGLARVDNIRAADFQTLHLRLALKHGDAYRFARALATEAAFVSTGGRRSRRRAVELLGQARRAAQSANHPHALALADFAEAIAAFYIGAFSDTISSCGRAERRFREECVGVAWEINTCQSYTLSSLYYVGAWRDLTRRVPARLKEAEDHGDIYAAADVAAGRPIVAWLIEGGLDEARATYQEALGRWTLQGFHFQHYVSLFAAGQMDLYAGEGFAAWSRVRARWHDLRRSMLLRIQQIRIEITDLRARAALAALAEGVADRSRLERSIERDARSLLGEGLVWSSGLAYLLLSALALGRGAQERAAALATRSASAFEAAGLSGHAAVARLRYGELLGGEEGGEIVRAGERWMSSQGVADVRRLSRMLAPLSR